MHNKSNVFIYFVHLTLSSLGHALHHIYETPRASSAYSLRGSDKSFT